MTIINIMKRITFLLTALVAPMTLFAKYGRDWDMYDTPRDNDGEWFWAIVIFGGMLYAIIKDSKKEK